MFGNGTLVFSKTNTSGTAIAAFVAVQQDLANNDGVTLALANTRVIAIAPEYIQNAGEVNPYAFSGIVRWIAGSGGWLRGDRLKSDANGAGVPIATTGSTPRQNVAAIAAEAASAGDCAFVQIFLVQETPGDYLS